MKIFTKREIEKKIIKENRGLISFKKKELILKEDTNSYVEPSGGNDISSLASDISKSKSKNPHDNEFIFNANSYDGDSSNDTVTLDVNGSTPADASKNYQKMTKNPNVKRLMNTTNVNAKVHLKNEQVEKLRESSVSFTKKEIKKIFK